MSLYSVDPNDSHHLFIVTWHLSSRTARRTRTFRPVTSCLDCCWRACIRPAGVSRRPAARWRTCVPAGDIVDAAAALRRSTGWGCGSCGSGGAYTSPSSSSPPLYLREKNRVSYYTVTDWPQLGENRWIKPTKELSHAPSLPFSSGYFEPSTELH